MTKTAFFMFLALTGLFEPSAIQQLPDGRFLVVEDEKAQPLSLLTIRLDGSTHSIPLLTDSEVDALKLDDLEGIAADSAGFVYAVTSHSRNSNGEEKKAREKLVRFRIEGDSLGSPRVVTGLKAALMSAHPVLANAAAIRDVKGAGGLNIEALEITPDGQRLLVGFRSPLQDNQALIAVVDNPGALFEFDANPQVSSPLLTLDLRGHGIRGMSYVPALSGYLVISGPVSKEQTPFQLWFWTGNPDESPRQVRVPGPHGLEHAEGVAPAMIEGRPTIVIVSDDGDRAQSRRVRVMDYDGAGFGIEPLA